MPRRAVSFHSRKCRNNTPPLYKGVYAGSGPLELPAIRIFAVREKIAVKRCERSEFHFRNADKRSSLGL